MNLYSTGYLGGCFPSKKAERRGKCEHFPVYRTKLETFVALVTILDLQVCDIRINPWSRWPAMTKKSLTQVLGERYSHFPQLGNTGRAEGVVRIADLSAGKEALIETVWATHRQPLLLCACEILECCHREEVGQALMRSGSFESWQEIVDWQSTIKESEVCA